MLRQNGHSARRIIIKLFLYSFAFTLSDEQANALAGLTGKEPKNIRVAVIDNAADVIPDSAEWVKNTHTILTDRGFQTEIVDLKKLQDDKVTLREKLSNKDLIWVNAGNTYYLRWMLQQSGADEIIIELVKKGVVYAGWSAGAMVAGPTLKHIEHMEDASAAPKVITDGLGLTDTVIVPHMDNPDFADAAKKTNNALTEAGFSTQPLNDTQALVIDGSSKQLI